MAKNRIEKELINKLAKNIAWYDKEMAYYYDRIDDYDSLCEKERKVTTRYRKVASKAVAKAMTKGLTIADVHKCEMRAKIVAYR